MAVIPELVLSLQAEAAIEAVVRKRPTVAAAPRVIRTKNLKKPVGFLSEGTAVTIVGRRQSRYLRDLADAIQSANLKAVDRACAVVLEREAAALRSMAALFTLDAATTIVDVSYGRSWLARQMVLSESADVAMSYAVWSGGDLNEKQFTARHYPKPEAPDTGIDVLIVLVEPSLTKIENALVRAIPSDLSDVHIQGPSVAWTTVLTIGGPEQQVVRGGPDPEQDVNRLGFPARLVTRMIGGVLGEQRQQETTVDQRQQQQEDTKQQQQQQQNQQADTAHQQQQQQQQQQDANTKQQQQQQQHEQDQQQGRQQERQQQQQQEQQRQTDQQQQQVQENQVNRADHQQDRYEQQRQQERQAAQTRVDNRQQNEHNHQDAQTRQQHEWSRLLDDLMGEGLSVRPFDNVRYRTLLEAIDFDSLDATQSVKALLRLREELLKEGLG